MNRYDYTSDALEGFASGLIVLQTDETIEGDFRAMTPADHRQYVSRVPSGAEVTPDSLQDMALHLKQAASLLPAAPKYGVVGYGCTSGTAQIGPEQISTLVRSGVSTEYVTEPLSALVAACDHLGVHRLAFLSPYVASVSDRLRDVLAQRGVTTPVSGGFDEENEAKVVRIDAASVHKAAVDLVRSGSVDAVFLSCTNLRTLDVIEPLETQIEMPVLSSNQVLAWHMGKLGGYGVSGPGRLFQTQA